MFDRRGARKYLNAAERLAFFRAAEREPDQLRRSFCLTLFFTGCRISEALNLTADGFDRSQKSLVFETLKRRRNGLFRAVPIPDSLVVLLAGLVGSQSRIWPFSRPTAYRMIKQVALEAGIDGAMACPKGLRHGFAVACVAQKVPLPTIQKWASR